MPRRALSFYSVYPRYSVGSPGMVNESTALDVAAHEKSGYEHALDGRSGPEQKARAQRLGLDGIVEELTEKVVRRRAVFQVRDVLTGEVYEKSSEERRKQIDERREANRR